MNKFLIAKSGRCIFNGIFGEIDLHKSYLQAAILGDIGKVLNDDGIEKFQDRQ